MMAIYRRLMTLPFFTTVELTENGEIAISTGCKYGDDTKLILYLIQGDNTLVLTDQGRTRDYMDKVFDLKEKDVIEKIQAVSDYYGISTKNKQLSLEIRSLDDYTEGIFRMIYCIGFLNTMQIFFK